MTLLAQPYRCNHCGKLREKDTNHWWLLRISPGHAAAITLARWDPALARDSSARHICGIECALAQLERWMQTGSFDPPSSEPITAGGAEGGKTNG